MDRLTVPGTLDSLADIGAYVGQAAASAGLDKRAAYKLRLAVDEIATNIVVHGYDEAGVQGTIDVWAEVESQDLRLIMEDHAAPFDPREAAPPVGMDLPLDQRPIGGLGVYLALNGVDELQYQRIDDRNRNTFVMHRPVDNG